MKLSILMPTVFPAAALRAIEDWRAQLRGIAHEFVVVCPREIGGESVRWIPEASPSGTLAASRLAYASASGDIAIQAADDVRFAMGAAHEALAAFADPNRKSPLALTFAPRARSVEFVSTAFGRLCPVFWAIGRADVERAGGYLDDSYDAAFAGHDLGLRIWRAGGEVRLGVSGVQAVETRRGDGEAPTKNAEASARDFAKLHARWAPSFDPVWGDREAGVALKISNVFLQSLSRDPRTLALDGPAAARDLRIAQAISIVADGYNVPMTREIAEAGLAYLRWVSELDPNPLQTFLAGRNKADLGRGP